MAAELRNAAVHSNPQKEEHFHFFTCKTGVKCPHQATRLMSILGFWSIAVQQDKTKDAFFSWKCSQMFQDQHQSGAGCVCAGNDPGVNTWRLPMNALQLLLSPSSGRGRQRLHAHDAELNSEPLIDGDSMDLRHMSGIPKLTEAEHQYKITIL